MAILAIGLGMTGSVCIFYTERGKTILLASVPHTLPGFRLACDEKDPLLNGWRKAVLQPLTE